MKRAAVLCLIGAIGVQVARDAAFAPAVQASEPLMYIRAPEVMTRIVLGFDALAADVYWIRALQHFGRQRLAAPGAGRDFTLLYPLLDLTTSLDPYFSIAYRFGAIFLSQPYPGGPGRPDLAVSLLRKGIAAQPEHWQYYHDIGFVYYWSLGDPTTAAEWFQRGAAQPNAPNWLAPVAAAVLTQGADRDSARQLWREMLASREEWLRQRAQIALAQLDAMDQIDRLNELIAGAAPPHDGAYSWTALVRSHRLPGIPVDPSGTPYALDPATGKVALAESSPLHPLPTTVLGR